MGAQRRTTRAARDHRAVATSASPRRADPAAAPEASPQATVVDRPVLIDHDLALSRVPCDSLRKRNPEQAVARQPRRAGENPGGGMAHRVEKVGLDDDNGPHLSWLRPASWTQVGEVQRTVLDGHLNRALRPRGDRGPPSP